MVGSTKTSVGCDHHRLSRQNSPKLQLSIALTLDVHAHLVLILLEHHKDNKFAESEMAHQQTIPPGSNCREDQRFFADQLSCNLKSTHPRFKIISTPRTLRFINETELSESNRFLNLIFTIF